MQKTIYKCDRCGKEINPLNRCGKVVYPKKIRLIDKLYGLFAVYQAEDEFELCKDCYNKLVKFMKEAKEDE